MTKPSETILRDYQLGRLAAADMEVVERWLSEAPGAADELSRVGARDRVTDALADTGAGGTSVPAVGPAGAPADVPDRLDWYAVVRELGRGGMGVVLEATDTRLGRNVAVKVIAPQFAADAGVRERFMQEARAVARIDHPNVAPVLQVGESDGVPYLVMPLLRGETLDARLKRERRLPAAEVKRIGREVAAGLAAAHAVGLIHRDIKPANVWLDAGTGQARILDFGLARPLERADTEALTRAGAVIGTPHYMAPEQAEGKPTDARADLFSLGVMLYHAATGERPFGGDTVLAVLLSVTRDKPLDPKALAPDLPPDLSRVIGALMHKSAAKRPDSAAAVASALSQPDLPPPAVPAAAPAAPALAFDDTEIDDREPRRRPAERQSRRGVWVATGLLAALLAATAAVVYFGGSGKETARSGAGDKGKSEPPKPGAPKPPPKPAPDADRAAAEAVLASDGRVYLNGRTAPHTGPLPKEPFRLTGVAWHKDRKVTDDHVAVLKNCKHITLVQMTETSVTDAGMATFSGWTQLVALDTQGTLITDAGHANFKGCTELQNLNIQTLFGHPRMTDRGAEHYRNCTKVTVLNLSYNAVTDRGVAVFANCADLGHLHLSGCEAVGDGTAALLARLPRLRFVNLQGTGVTDAGADRLPACTNLTDLNLIGTKVTEAKAKELAGRMPWCRILWGEAVFEPTAPDRRAAQWVLNATGAAVRVNGEARDVRSHADLPADDFELTGVGLSGIGVDDSTVAPLAGCRHLTRVDLTGTAVTAAGLKHLQSSAGLTELILERCAKVTDEAMPQMKKHPKLTRLVLLGTDITDTGADHLKECTSLRELWVNAPKVSGGKVFGLHKALPKCLIVGSDDRYGPTEKD